MSDTNLNVAVTASTDGFKGAMEGARVSAAEFQAALKAAGSDAMAAAKNILQAADAARQTGAAMQAAGAQVRTASTNFKQVIEDATGLSRSFNSAAESARVFEQALNPSPLQRMKQLMDENTESAHGTAGASHGVFRELVVMGHEAMSGNFSRIPGSFMVLAERVNLASGAMMAGVGAAVGLGLAFYHLAMNAHQAAVELNNAYTAAQLQGRNATEARAAVENMTTSMAQTGLVGTSSARQIGAAIESVAHVSDDARAKIASIGPALNIALGHNDAEKTAQEIERIFGSESGLKAFVDQNDILTSSQKNAMQAAFDAKDAYSAQGIVVDALVAKYKTAQDAMQKQQQAASLFKSMQIAAGPEGLPAALAGMTAAGEVPQMPPLVLPDITPPREDPAIQRQNAVEREYNTTLREQQKILSDIAVLKQKRAGETDPAAQQATDAAIKQAQDQLDNLKGSGQPSWIQNEELALEQSNENIERNAKTYAAAHDAMLKNTISFWSDVLKQDNLSTQQRMDAQLRLARARQELDMETLKVSSAGERQGVEEQIAALSAQQAADRDNYEQVISLENQKLAVLKTAYGERSRQYQAELRTMENMEREHQNQVVAAQLDSLAKQREVDSQRVSEFRAQQDQLVTEEQQTKQQALAAEIDYEAQVVAKETDALTALLNTLQEGTEAYRKAYAEREALAAKFAADQARNNQQVAQADAQAAKQSAQVYMQAFSQIGSSADRTVSELVVGTTTVQKAELQLAQSIVSSVVGALMHVAEQAIATQAAQLIGIQQVSQAQQAAGQTGFAAIGEWLLKQLGLVSSTSAETVAQSKITSTGEVSDAAGVAAANAYAATAAIPVVGPEMAPGAAAEAFGDVMGFGSFAVGAWDLPNDMMAQLHAGEMVVPATFAEGLRSGGNSFGGGTNTNINYAPSLTHQAAGPMSRKEAETFFAAHAPALKGAVMDGVRTGRLGGSIARGVGRPR